MKHVLMLVICTTLVGACAVSPSAPSYSEAPNPDMSSGKAILYVYREHAEPTAWSATLSMDDKELVALAEKGFSWIYINPGKHRFKISWPLLAGMPKNEFESEFEKDKVYVFEMKGRVDIVGMQGMTVLAAGKTSLMPVEPDAAKSIMTKCCRFVSPTSQTQ